MHLVGIMALHDVVPFDLGIPCDVFERVRLGDGTKPYELRICGQARRLRARPFDIQVGHTLSGLDGSDTIIVPGTEAVGQPDTPAPVPAVAIEVLRRAAARGARVASICSGAFVLAAAGLLDGRRATTHWLAADDLARLHPNVTVDPNVLFVDEGQVVTSAGASAGIDMCLHLVAGDHGHAIAAAAARRAVAPLGREGGQRQFIQRSEIPRRVAGGRIGATLAWIEDRLSGPLSVAEMAAHARMSPRTFARRFVEETGTTPTQWLIEARTRHARLLLETTLLPVDEVAARAGFADASGLRDRFKRVLGVSPRSYRGSFGTSRTTTIKSRATS